MVDIPSGTFALGSADGEPDERPPRTITVNAFQIAAREVTVGEFRRFVDATGHTPAPGCNRYIDGKLTAVSDLSWRNPGFPQGDSFPVACVGWNDAQAYIAWLNTTTGKRFRLPTEAEWEYAAKAGNSSSDRPWTDAVNACAAANVMDRTAAAASDSKMIFGDPTKYLSTDEQVFPCSDGYLYAAPVGSFAANAWGVYDIIGNVWEFVQDCGATSYGEWPADAGAVETRDCERRGIRGSGWNIGPKFARIANRSTMAPDGRNWGIGFRLAHDAP